MPKLFTKPQKQDLCPSFSPNHKNKIYAQAFHQTTKTRFMPKLFTKPQNKIYAQAFHQTTKTRFMAKLFTKPQKQDLCPSFSPNHKKKIYAQAFHQTTKMQIDVGEIRGMAYFTRKWRSDILLRVYDSVCNEFSCALGN